MNWISVKKIEWIDFENLPKNIALSIKIELDNIKRGFYYSKEEK